MRGGSEADRGRSTFALLHGAGSTSWYWHLVAPRLVDAGHEAVAVEFPVDDDACGLAEYASTGVEVIGSRPHLTLVAQSMAAFTAPMIATMIPVELIVLVAPMVPAPGETAGEWWDNTGQPDAARQSAIAERRDPHAPFDPVEVFLHDVAPAVAAAAGDHVRAQSHRPFSDPWPLEGWPDVTTRCVIDQHDRLFPPDFQRRVLGDRLGITPDEIDAGHLPALSRPDDLAALLVRYQATASSRPAV